MKKRQQQGVHHAEPGPLARPLAAVAYEFACSTWEKKANKGGTQNLERRVCKAFARAIDGHRATKTEMANFVGACHVQELTC